MGDAIILIVILTFISIILLAIGISQIKSKEPVGFYSGEKPPKKEELSDVAAWNRQHGLMWIVYNISIIIATTLCVLIESEAITLFLYIGIILGGIWGLMLYHHHLKKKYYIAPTNTQNIADVTDSDESDDLQILE